MNPEHIAGARCAELSSFVDRIANYAGSCEKRKWRGPLCRALQVYAAFWRFRDRGEVPLSAEALGLSERHVKYLIPAQRRFGKSAPFEALAGYYVWVLEEVHRRQLLLDLAKVLGLV